MPQVLAHLLAPLRPVQSLLQHILRPLSHGPISVFITYLFIFVHALGSFTFCAAQTINGQTYTNGLAIINAPSPESEQHAGSTVVISIELSGNGKLPFKAFTPGSGLASSYGLLEIYLISVQAGLNLTVSSGTDLLTEESGTVRHHDFALPTCLPTGQYNLTFYETSVINDIPCFTITPIPISIQNDAGSHSSCNEGINPLQPLPQPSSDFGRSPFNPSQQIAISTGTMAQGAGATQTRPQGPGAHPSQIEPTSSSGGVTSNPTAPPLPEDSPSKAPGSVTLVIVSQVVTTITDGQDGVITTSYMTTRTTTVPVNTAASSGFIPINAGKARLNYLTSIFIPFLVILWVVILTFTLE